LTIFRHLHDCLQVSAAQISIDRATLSGDQLLAKLETEHADEQMTLREKRAKFGVR
jgi:hypothetical protein